MRQPLDEFLAPVAVPAPVAAANLGLSVLEDSL